MKPRLLQSHFSLENVKGFLKANDLSHCSKIILIHLSAANSHAERMVREIRELTGIETVVADPGLELELNQYPY
jgi:pentose-5-phosphate-3-epimerase